MLEKKFMKNPDIVSRKIADETILVPIKNNVGDLRHLFTLNDVGARIWELIDGTKTRAQLCERVADEFEAERSAVDADVADFLRALAEVDAIKEVV